MIDSNLRRLLVRDISRLANGQDDVDAFDERFYFRYSSTDDHAVREIAHLIFVRDRIDIDQDGPTDAVQVDPATVARCLLFLRSGREYDWPGDTLNPGRKFIVGFTVFLIIPVIMAVLFYYVPVSLAVSGEFTTPLAWMGIVGMLAALGILAFQPGRQPRQHPAADELEFWPFANHRDLQDAAQQCHVSSHLHGHYI